MSVINFRSIPDAVSKGALIDLSNDYRTSGTVRACLSPQTTCTFAISKAAYSRYLQPPAQDRNARVEAVCFVLRTVLGFKRAPSSSDLEFRLLGRSGTPEDPALKLEWYAQDKCWVVLLADEQLQPVANPSQIGSDVPVRIAQTEVRRATSTQSA
jgi:hypothetical protein